MTSAPRFWSIDDVAPLAVSWSATSVARHLQVHQKATASPPAGAVIGRSMRVLTAGVLPCGPAITTVLGLNEPHDPSTVGVEVPIQLSPRAR